MTRELDLSHVVARRKAIDAELRRLRRQRRECIATLRFALARLEQLDCDGADEPCEAAADVRRLLAKLETP